MNNLSAKFSSVRGDFFVYSDIYVDGKPNYWSGFFSTRPFVKQLDRDLEASLRSAEILYTLALGMARQNKASRIVQLLEEDFARLVTARRHLGLFQHHDAITGTSKSFVMKDYAFKLLQGIRDTKAIQSRSVHSLLMLPPGINIAERPSSKLGHVKNRCLTYPVVCDFSFSLLDPCIRHNQKRLRSAGKKRADFCGNRRPQKTCGSFQLTWPTTTGSCASSSLLAGRTSFRRPWGGYSLSNKSCFGWFRNAEGPVCDGVGRRFASPDDNHIRP